MRLILLITFLFTALPVYAETADCGSIKCGSQAPSFEQYAVTASFTGKPKPVQLHSHPRAKRYRSALAAAAENGPNFASHYTIVILGCGTACQEFAIVDARNGKVFFPPNLRLNAYHVVHEDAPPEPFQFSKESSLLAVVGSPNDAEDKGVFFYVWDGKALRLKYKEARDWK